MSKKYTPAIFQPTLRPSWGGALSYISTEEKSEILEALINYPKNIDIDSRFWEETIKPDLDTQYESFIDTCQAKGRGAKSYWEKMGKDKHNISYTDVKDMDNISISQVIDKDNSLKDKDKNKDNDKDNRYGELKNVRLTESQYKELSEKYNNLNLAIEKLDTWLGTSGSKNKNKNHYAYFKSNSWVWENLQEKPDAFDLYTQLDQRKREETSRLASIAERTMEELRKKAEARYGN